MIPTRYRISTQVSAIATAILVVAVLAFSLLAYFRTSAVLDARGAAELQARVQLIEQQLETFDATVKASADRLSRILMDRIGTVRVDAVRTVTVGERTVPVATGSDGPLALDFAAVDEFTRATGGVATVLVRVDDDFMRVTTSLRKEDGSRALGTLLGSAHPAYASVMKGEPFLGKARLFGRHYMTKYMPVKDGAGRVSAILFVGFDVTDAMAALVKQIATARIGDSGYYFLLDASKGKTRGELIAHPHKAGASVLEDASLEVYRALLAEAPPRQSESGGRILVQVPFAAWEWMVGASVDQAELHRDAASLRNLMMVLGLVVLGAGCLATYVVLSRRLAPLARLAADAERLGAGDLTVRASHASRDEIGELAHAFNAMAGQFAGITARMQQASARLKDAVARVREDSATVQEGSREQSDSASRVAAALEEVTVSLQLVGDNARDSQRLSRRTSEISTHGESVVRRTAYEIGRIAGAVREAAGAIDGLSQRSGEITRVIKVIKDIADQTNLLALNAAIEAARAGEQGRGFAVVADEVRKLAERTASATVEIGGMIEAIQAETRRAVGGMESSSEQVEEGVRLAREAAGSLSGILEAAGESLVKASEIVASMDEQDAAGAEIARNVERIAAMADANTSSAARSHASVQELESLAAELEVLTAGLKTA
jgi:methyl-accepting chemotaxis protein